MTDKLNIGVIGGGMISQIAHLPFYMNDERVRVSAVAESRPSLIEHLRTSVGVPSVLADYRELLQDRDIGTVVIVAPRQATGPIVLEALNAGKNVITEKPMAFTAAQAGRLAEAAKANGVSFFVGFMKRYDAGVQAGKALVDERIADGRLGKLLCARFYDYAKSYAHPPPPHKRPEESRVQRFETWPTAPDWLAQAHHAMYGWFVNAASHDVNLMRYFFGDDVALRHADAPSQGALSACFRAGDVAVDLQCATSETGVWQEGAEFVFERGRVALEIPSPMDTESVTRVVVDDNGAENPDGYARRVLDVPVEWCFQSQARAFIDALCAGTPSLSSGEDCLGDMIVTEAIWKMIGEQADVR